MSSVFIEGKMVDVGDGAHEILRLRALLIKRNETIRKLQDRVDELEGIICTFGLKNAWRIIHE